jgi:hypothetical protein
MWKKSKIVTFMIRRKFFVTNGSDALKLLYYAMVLQHISHRINIYGCVNTKTLNILRLKQKEAIGIVREAGYRDHTTLLFTQLGTLPLNDTQI